MKKGFKSKILFLVFTMVFMLPFVVKAATFKPSMSCPSSASPGDTISCSITATIDNSITGIQGIFDIGGTTFVSFDKGKMNFYTVGKEGFTAGETDGIAAVVGSTNITIGTLKVKVPEGTSGTYNIRVKEVAATDTDFNTINASDLSQTVTARVKSTDSSLKSLEVEGMTLGPNFSPSVFEYSLMETDKAAITVKATPNDSNVKSVTGTGKVDLKFGSNVITIKVTSEAGNVSNYTIKVTRTDTRESINTLKSLTVKDYKISPDFKPETKTYTLTVEPNVDKVTVEAELTSAKSSFDSNNKPGTFSLKYGKNAIIIKVKAENEKVNTYTINVTRTDDRDANNYLSSITLSDGNINFDKNTTSYTVNVNSNLKEITISAIAESTKAKVSGSGTKKLKDGSNTFEITVKAENESIRKYKIIVNRGAATEVVTPDTNETNETANTNETTQPKEYLKSIIIKNHDINFDPNVFNYNITLGEGEDKLDILYQAGDGYTATVEGNENLKDGSVVKIIVEKDGETVEYKFKVSVEEKKTGGSIILYVALGLLGLVVFGLLLAVFTKKKPTPEEVVRDKFVDEGPRTFHNERLITDGVDSKLVTGSMIAQVERPNSMSDMPATPAPAPTPTPEPVAPAYDEIVMESTPLTTNDMEPMPINGPITSEVAGDFTPSPDVSFEPIEMQSSDQTFQMSEPSDWAK